MKNIVCQKWKLTKQEKTGPQLTGWGKCVAARKLAPPFYLKHEHSYNLRGNNTCQSRIFGHI